MERSRKTHENGGKLLNTPFSAKFYQRMKKKQALDSFLQSQNPKAAVCHHVNISMCDVYALGSFS